MFFSAATMGILILDSRAAMAYAAEGLELCIRTVIPSLFPLCVMSMCLTAQVHSFAFLRPLGRMFGLRRGTESILLTGLLGGYPIGAQNAAIAYRSGVLTEEEANRMISFCSQPGPAFLFGILGGIFTLGQCWTLWVIILAGSLAVSVLIPGRRIGPKVHAFAPSNRTSVLKKAMAAMGNICCWIILMGIVIGFLQRWFLWLLPESSQCTISGILELTNGCCMLGSVPDPRLRFILAAGMLSFGGVCVLLQTHSLIQGLDIGRYIMGKVMQTCICVALACVVCGYYAAGIPLLAFIGLALAGKSRKKSSIPAAIGV